MHRKFLGVGAAFVVGAALALPAGAAGRTTEVFAGGPPAFAGELQQNYGAGINNYLLDKVTIHEGDSVEWSGLAAGFHTVDIPEAGGSDLPLIIPSGTNVGDVKDAAGNPFWFDGQPNLTFNPTLFQPIGGNVYNGSARIDSGLPFGPPQPFKVAFTKPGVYHYFCDVHYGMTGTVVVVAKNKPVPSPHQNSVALIKAEKAYVASAKRVDATKPPANSVSVGASGPSGLEVFAFFPGELHVASGTTVNFFMSEATRETHTATFGDTSEGGYVFNLGQTAFSSPTGLIDPRGAYPSSVPMPISLSPASHGNGFANTGALDRDTGTPTPASAQITFTEPGTYHYICLIHPFMHGTVIVR